MLKKALFLSLVFLSFNSFSKEKEEENICEMKGVVDLPSHFLGNDSYIVAYNLSAKINKNKEFCFKDTIDHRGEFYLYVMKEGNMILKNKIIRGYDNLEEITLNLKKSISEKACENGECDNKTIQTNMRLRSVKEISDEFIAKYYKKYTPSFDYEKVEKKMEKKEREVQHARKKEIVEISGESYFPFEGDIYSTNYNSFSYKKSIIRKDRDLFLNNKDILKGIDVVDEHPDIILTHWLRYLYYYGNDYGFSGALYSTSFKQDLIINEDYEKPLKFSKAYQNKLRNGTKVRGKKDERFFKKTTEGLRNKFKRRKEHIYNLKPDYVNIEFIFENGSWRLNKFDVNDKYIRSIK